MATFTLNGTVGGRIYSTDGTYANARSGAALASDDVGNSGLTVGQLYYSGTYYCYEGFVQFDTSSVVGNVLSVTLKLYSRQNTGTVNPFTVYARAYDWGASLTTGDWVAGASLSANALRASAANTSIGSGAYYSLTSDGSFVSNTANPVRLIVSGSRHEGDIVPPIFPDALTNPTYDERVFFDTPTGGNPPQLVVVTDAAAGVPSRRRPLGLYTR